MSEARTSTRKAKRVRRPCVQARQVDNSRDLMEVDRNCSTTAQQGGKRRRVTSNKWPPTNVSHTRNGVVLTKKDVTEMANYTSTPRNNGTVSIPGNDVRMTQNDSLAITGDEVRLIELRDKVQQSSGAAPRVCSPKYNRELLDLCEPKIDLGRPEEIYMWVKTLRDVTSAVKTETVVQLKCRTEERDRLVQELADSRGRENVLKEELTRESAEMLKLSQEAVEQKIQYDKLSREAEEQKVHYDSQVSRYKQVYDASKNHISGLTSKNEDLERRIAACESRQREADDLVARLQNEKEEMSKRAQREKAELNEKHTQVTGGMAQRHEEAMDKMEKREEEIQISLRKCEKQKRAMEMEQVAKEQLLQETKKVLEDSCREWEGQKRALEMQQVQKEQLLQKTKEELELSLGRFEQQKRAFEIQQAEKEQLLQKTKEELEFSLGECQEQKRALEIQQVAAEQLLQKTKKELESSLGESSWACEEQKRAFDIQEVETEQLRRDNRSLNTKLKLYADAQKVSDEKREYLCKLLEEKQNDDLVARLQSEKDEMQKTKEELHFSLREYERQKRELKMQQVEKEQLLQKTKTELQDFRREWEGQRRALEMQQVEKEQILQKTKKELQDGRREWEGQKRALEMQRVEKEQLLQKTVEFYLGECEQQKHAFEIQQGETEQLLEKTKKELEYSLGEREEQKCAFEMQQVKTEQLLQKTQKELKFSLGNREEQKRAFELQLVEADQLLQKTNKEFESSLGELSQEYEAQNHAFEIQKVELLRENCSLNRNLKLYADAQKASDEKSEYLRKLLEEKENEFKEEKERAKRQQDTLTQALGNAQRRGSCWEEEAILWAHQRNDEEAGRLKQRLTIIQGLIQYQVKFLQGIQLDSSHETHIMSILAQLPLHNNTKDLRQTILQLYGKVVKDFHRVKDVYLREMCALLGNTSLLDEKMAARKASREKKLQDDLQEDREEEERLMQKLAIIQRLIEEQVRSQHAGNFFDSSFVMSTVPQIYPPCTSEEDLKQVIAEFYGKVEKEFREARNKFLEEIGELLRDTEYLDGEIAKRTKTEKKLQNERKTREKSYQDERKIRAKRLQDMVQLLQRLQSGKLDD